MNRLSSKQRKFVYLAGIIVLLIPIFLLGLPGSSEGVEGKLSQLRRKYSLGESDIGAVDPTSSAMNLVLLGFRGIAADLMWMDLNDNQEKKNWAQLRGDVDALIMLQPHFIKVWTFQGHNLSYNISVAWDLVSDRYFWVKEGAKFLKRGIQLNRTQAMLPYSEGQIIGTKIGRADEWQYYRKFFNKKDPNEELYHGGPDTDLNPEAKDHYQVAKDIYTHANELEAKYGEVRMMRPIFRQYPSRSQLSYADVLQKEGIFDEQSENAWKDGYQDWEDFGREENPSAAGTYRLDMSPKEIEEAAKAQKIEVADFMHEVRTAQDVVRYNYWKTRAKAESDREALAAHKAIYDGTASFKKASLSTAKDQLFQGMTLFQQLIDKYPVFKGDSDSLDEGMNAVLYWQYILKLQFQPIPEKFPLSELWTQHQDDVPALEQRFKRENNIQ